MSEAFGTAAPTATAFATVAELGRAIRSGAVSPVTLAEQFLARLDTVGRRLNAVVTLTPELALAQARQAEDELAAGVDRGPLHGIPYGAKDLLAVPGYPTTWGAAPFAEQRFDAEAAVIERLREAGAVLVAKLAMVELAGGFGYEQPNAALTGPGRNAWDPAAWAGGSSSGSGSAVAAGCVPFAIGTETWGSIHCPAAFNGITGLRPTYGRVSRRGAMALSWTMDKIGPMARTADDCALVYAAIAGPDPADPTTLAQREPPPIAGEPIPLRRLPCRLGTRPTGGGRQRRRVAGDPGGARHGRGGRSAGRPVGRGGRNDRAVRGGVGLRGVHPRRRRRRADRARGPRRVGPRAGRSPPSTTCGRCGSAAPAAGRWTALLSRYDALVAPTYPARRLADRRPVRDLLRAGAAAQPGRGRQPLRVAVDHRAQRLRRTRIADGPGVAGPRLGRGAPPGRWGGVSSANGLAYQASRGVTSRPVVV